MASSNLLNGPSRVLCDQRLRVSCHAFQRRKIGYIAGIAQGDAHIAKKAPTLNSLDRRIFEKLAELSVAQFQVFPQ